MEVIRRHFWRDVSEDFTGIVKPEKDNTTAAFYFQDGKLHREDGPAANYISGYKQFWLRGFDFKTKEEWFDALSEEGKEKAIWNIDEWINIKYSDLK